MPRYWLINVLVVVFAVTIAGSFQFALWNLLARAAKEPRSPEITHTFHTLAKLKEMRKLFTAPMRSLTSD